MCGRHGHTLVSRYPLIAEWETRVMATLVECKTMGVYVAGLLMSEKDCPRTNERSGSQLFVPLQLLFSSSHLAMEPERWYQRLWKSITSMFPVGEKETLTHVDMIDCMDGKPLSDKSI
ncbi:hypothetical protein TNIN_18471 [Trichonephila inaurata madagascariensis]|uniref:Uncharacterized protein n=1 Tax=Trichonephila inaurata madagascariensis TaxID=2747483 RepID=A0A8X7BYG5_9ARAC|nr:hypothetical protein TNIN_18471 [Trichonephila inaurata madagascariensis]